MTDYSFACTKKSFRGTLSFLWSESLIAYWSKTVIFGA